MRDDLISRPSRSTSLPRGKGTTRIPADHPRLSVVIPHLNEPEDLRRCLLSLETQRHDGIPFEIIVADNGSTRRPETVCAEFTDVRVEIETVPGPGPARNKGAAAARADLLAFIDADCVAEAGWVRAIVDFFDRHPETDFLGGDIRILPANPDRLTSIEAYESVYSYRAQRYVEEYGFAATGNMAVRARVFQAAGPFGGIGSMEDTEWGQRATARGFRIAYLPQALVRTPSCKSFAELARRWDRHVAHEFRNVKESRMGLLRWMIGGAIIAASPAGEAVRLMRTDRLSGLRERWAAFKCLTRVRLYRARRMFGLAFHDNAATLVDSWNRERSGS